VQGEVFEGELAVAAAKKGQKAKQLEQEGDHRTRIFSGSEPADQPLPAGLNLAKDKQLTVMGKTQGPPVICCSVNRGFFIAILPSR